jgi:hypothetical protein
MNEASFSRWLCKQLKDQGLFVQRLEVTTGAGIPDLAVLGIIQQEERINSRGTTVYYDSEPRTLWCELKWETKHIRPEQYVWGLKAMNAGVNVNYVVGSDETLALYSIDNAVKMTNSFKLTHQLYEGPRTKKGITDMLQHLQ